MAICEYVNCKGHYKPTTNWQRFCSPKCRDDDKYYQRKLAQRREAEELVALRKATANGGGGVKPLSEIMQLRAPTAPPMIRRV